MILRLIICIFVLAVPALTWGACHTGFSSGECLVTSDGETPSCEQADVAAAITQVASGDTVTLGAGSCSWTAASQYSGAAITIPSAKTITMQGSGTLGTTITESHTTHIQWGVLSIGNGSGIKNIKINFGVIRVTNNFSVSGCWLSNNVILLSGLSTVGTLVGTIYNNRFTNAKAVVTTPASTSIANSHSWWAVDRPMGSATYGIYIEDNLFDTLTSRIGQVVDSNYGGAYVFRYNTLINKYAEAHSLQDAAGNSIRAHRAWEFYGNDFTTTVAGLVWPFSLRSATGIVFYNRVAANYTNSGIMLDYRRDNENMATAGMCNGSSEWDGNETISNSDFYTTGVYTGTHTGDGGDCTDACASLVDDTNNWPANVLSRTATAPGATVINLSDCSSETESSCSRCAITSNSSTAVICTLSGGVQNEWDVGDEYRISDGYPCRDQIGRGRDAATWSIGSVYAQEIQPAYAWNNKKTDDAELLFTVKGAVFSAHAKSNRDYYNYNTSFDGSSGVGCGTLANRPETCTTGVGYWATEQSCSSVSDYVGNIDTAPERLTINGVMWRCTATNVWSAYFTPYSYPHIDRGGDDIYTLTTAVVGTGKVVSTSNKTLITDEGSTTESVRAGHSIILTASETTGGALVSWAGCSLTHGNQCIVDIIDDDITVTATFASSGSASYYISPVVSGGGEIINNFGEYVLSGGNSVERTAHPSPGWYFAGWSGTCGCTGTGSCTATNVTADCGITATFTEKKVLKWIK